MHIICSQSWSLDTQCLEKMISSQPLADDYFPIRIASGVWCRLIGISCRKTWKLEKFISRTKIRLCQLFHWIWGNLQPIFRICWSADRYHPRVKCGLLQALHRCSLGHLLSKHVRKLYLLGKPSTNQKYLNQAKISPPAFLAQTALQLYDISPQRCGQSISDFVKSYYFQSEGHLHPPSSIGKTASLAPNAC